MPTPTKPGINDGLGHDLAGLSAVRHDFGARVKASARAALALKKIRSELALDRHNQWEAHRVTVETMRDLHRLLAAQGNLLRKAEHRLEVLEVRMKYTRVLIAATALVLWAFIIWMWILRWVS